MSNFLDVDDSKLSSSLLINEKNASYLQPQFENPAYSLCHPQAGFCFKCWDAATKKKVFINICHLDVLPEPPNIEDCGHNEEYRIPMSVGDVRCEMDQKGIEVTVVDIAFNTNFLRATSKNFILDISRHAVHEKYKLALADEVVVLKNRKAFGELQMHRVKNLEGTKKLIEDVSLQEKYLLSANFDHAMTTPEYRVFKQKSDPYTLIAEIKLPYVGSSKDFTLDIGEDRVILESKVGNYFLDTFFPCVVNPDFCTAFFHKDSRVLTIRMQIDD